MDAIALSKSAGVHVTTVRYHLEALEGAGLVERHVERAGAPGRPRLLYTAGPDTDRLSGDRQLAGVLAGALAADPATGAAWAEGAGRRWADQLLPAGGAGAAPPAWDDATRRVGALFADVGFEPVLVDEPHLRRFELHACPFRELAAAHPDVVCTVHLGLLRGALSRLQVRQAPQASLRPFVGPELCVADVPRPSEEGEQRCLASAS